MAVPVAVPAPSPYADVELRWLDLAEPVGEAALATLDAEERARAAAFRFERDRVRYQRRRAHLRRILAEVTGQPAAELRYAVGDHGKPHLPDHPGLHLSTSSSGPVGVVAWAAQPLGVDVEQERPDNADHDVALRLFAPEEVAALEAAPDFAAGFFRCWSRKEAYVKATGLGLSFPLESFAVEVHDTASPRLLRSTLRPGDLASARLASLDVPGGGAAAALVLLAHPDLAH